MKEYNKANIPLAKALRRDMTPWERKLWYTYLRQYPIRFQRQKALGNYIADFYCAKVRLVIELDGGGHYEPEQQVLDAQRTEALEKMGLTVLRFCNLDIDRNFRGVCEKIDMLVQSSLPQSAWLTAPSSEGAKNRRTIYALGFFDGVHVGHQALLAECRRVADELGYQTGVVTFLGHPDTLVSGITPKLINTPDDRERLLRSYGMERIIALPFDKPLMEMPWQDFFRLLTTEYHAGGLVCGADFRFGHRGEGNAQRLQTICAEAGIPCIVVPEQTLEGITVSSTHIRSLLERGEMGEAVKFLGHPHILTGTVTSGQKIGRTIGIPTANLTLPAGCVVPKFGVYACKILGHPAVTNIGTRPTVGGSGITVEPWILDFDDDLYDQDITVEFHAFLRPEVKFPSLEYLRLEILSNAEQTRQYFKES
jgi:riboflavin kinase/FMN adenylyltransferase